MSPILLTALLQHLVFATPVFLLLTWLLRKWRFTQKHRIWWALGGTVVVYPVTLTSFIIAFFAFADRVPQENFSREKWLTNTEERFRMKDNLLESKVLEGKSKLDVQQLLGRTDYYIQPVWHYNMGAASAGMGFRFYILRVEFEQDTVKKIVVLEHLE